MRANGRKFTARSASQRILMLPSPAEKKPSCNRTGSTFFVPNRCWVKFSAASDSGKRNVGPLDCHRDKQDHGKSKNAKNVKNEKNAENVKHMKHENNSKNANNVQFVKHREIREPVNL